MLKTPLRNVSDSASYNGHNNHRDQQPFNIQLGGQVTQVRQKVGSDIHLI